jgi:hypothetical protein
MRFVPEAQLVENSQPIVAQLGQSPLLISDDGATTVAEPVGDQRVMRIVGGAPNGVLVVAESPPPCPAGTSLHLIDTTTSQTRWSAPLRYDGYLPFLSEVLGDQVLFAYSFTARNLPRREPEDLVIGSIDARTGREIWERNFPEVTSYLGTLYAQGDRVLSSGPGGTLRVLDPKTGRDLWAWHVEAGSKSIMDTQTNGSRVALLVGRGDQNCDIDRPLWCETRIVLLDGRDGALVHAGPWQEEWRPPSMLLAGADVFLLLHTKLGPYVGSIVVALDSANGKERWRTKPLLGSFAGGSAMVATVEKLYVCTDDGMLRVLSRSNGTELAKVGVGECEALYLQGTRVIVASVRGILLVDEAAFSAKERQTVVTGRVSLSPPAPPTAPPYTLTIGEHVLKTDDRGRFRKVVKGRGIVRVMALLTETQRRREWMPDAPAYVTLGATPSSVVEVQIRMIDD